MMSFIKAYKFYILIGVMFTVLSGVIAFQQSRINSLNEEKGECQAVISAYEVAEEQWIKRINEQNKSIENLEQTEKELNERLSESREERRQQAREYEQRIRDLHGQSIPESCEGAMEFLLERAMEGKDFRENR